jgi:integrase
MSFLEYYLDFMIKSKTEINHRSKKPLSKETLKSYQSVFNNLKEYNDTRHKITFENIDLDFYHNFIEFLELKGYSTNYIGTHVKNLKCVLTNATEDGINTNIAFKSKRFSKPSEEVDNIYLTINELQLLRDLKTNNELESNVRDFFLIGAFTGLRVNDYVQLTNENIITHKGEKYIKTRTNKTGKDVVIPIHPIIKEILNLRDGTIPKKVSDQKINVVIKELGRRACINEKVEVNRTRGGKRITLKKEKYKLISTHTCRRSFCTNSYLEHMTVIDIMALSGHSSERSFLKYIKVSALERAEKIAIHPFFRSGTLKIVS